MVPRIFDSAPNKLSDSKKVQMNDGRDQNSES